LELKIEGMETYGHVLIQIFSAKTAVCPLNIKKTYIATTPLDDFWHFAWFSG
jgi:hypothetical protein